jgi:magnesium transporter
MSKRRPRSLRLRKSRDQQAVPDERHPRSWYRDDTGAVRRDIDPHEFAAIVAAGTGMLWADLHSASPPQQALLETAFRFHPLSVEDTQSPDGRVKFEDFGRYAFAVVRGVRFIPETEDRYDIETFNVWCFIGPNFVVTVHGAHAPGVEQVAERLALAPELLARGPARLMHAILDATVDAYFPILDQLDEFVDGLEERVFVQFDQAALRDIFSVKRLVLQLRRHLAPMREVFNVLQNRPIAVVPPDVQIYFRDIYDHVIRLNESLDSYRDELSSTLDAYLTQVSNRMGLVTKGLTVVATLSVPFVVVSGMWGMNFARVPFADRPGGFLWLVLIQLALGLGLLALLKRRGWL